MTPAQRRARKKVCKQKVLEAGYGYLASLTMPEPTRDTLLVWWTTLALVNDGLNVLGLIIAQHPEVQLYVEKAGELMDQDIQADPESIFAAVVPDASEDALPTEG